MNALMVLCAVALTSAAPEEVARLDVGQAVERALAKDPQLAAGRERREAAADQARSVRGQLLPSIAVSEEFQYYDSPFSIPSRIR